MAHEFCEHLDIYGAQFARTEASYQQCVHLLDRLLAGEPDTDLARLVTEAVAEWSAEDAKLRDMLVVEVREGRVRIPKGILHGKSVAAIKQRRHAKRVGHPVCATCRIVVPRLAYPEWKVAHNGEASFRGQELPLAAPQPA